MMHYILRHAAFFLNRNIRRITNDDVYCRKQSLLCFIQYINALEVNTYIQFRSVTS
jgi:hypothetical protein